jgi:hypothetical protein
MFLPYLTFSETLTHPSLSGKRGNVLCRMPPDSFVNQVMNSRQRPRGTSSEYDATIPNIFTSVVALNHIKMRQLFEAMIVIGLDVLFC